MRICAMVTFEVVPTASSSSSSHRESVSNPNLVSWRVHGPLRNKAL